VISLQSILAKAFGASFSGLNNLYVYYIGSNDLQSNGYSYWDPAHPSVSSWYINGQDIGPWDVAGSQRVSLTQVGNVLLHVGNDIGPTAYIGFSISVGTPVTQYVQYQVNVVDPALISPTAANGAPTAADVVAAANRFSNFYGTPANTSDCHTIASDVAAAAGASLPVLSGSNDPTQNVDGGFWRVVYRGSDHIGSAPTLHTLLQPGDIIRLAWLHPTPGVLGHTTTVLSTHPDGTITVYDNSASGTGQIGIHTWNLDNAVIPESVTIYRLSPDHLYVISGSDQGEILNGSPYNNRFDTGGGNDVVNCGSGNDIVDVGTGNKTINGGGGHDLAVFSVGSGGATIIDASGHTTTALAGQTISVSGSVTVTWSGGVDHLVNVSTLQFNDSVTVAGIQTEYAAITRTPLSQGMANEVTDWINFGTQAEARFINGDFVFGTQTEAQYVSSLLAQVANTTIPAVMVEGSMYGAVGTSAEITKLVTQYLPAQVANATQNGYNPQVYACEALGLAFAFSDENGGTKFAANFGPSSSAMPNTTAGDAAFAAAAAATLFGSSATPNTPGAIAGFVANWKAFFTAHGVVGISNATPDQIDLAARGAAWGDAVGIALANNLGPLVGQVNNFLADAAQGAAIYSAPLASQPNHAPFQGSSAADASQLIGIGADHLVS
jgi:hypothetical protein